MFCREVLDVKKIGIGYENYKEFIDKDMYYIDKTMLIRDLDKRGGKVTLFTRPRRFGKTLNMSMLKYFFEKSEIDNSCLFDDLDISKVGEKYLSYQGQYPVISVSLKGMKQSTYEMAFFQFKNLVIISFHRTPSCKIVHLQGTGRSSKIRASQIFLQVGSCSYFTTFSRCVIITRTD